MMSIRWEENDPFILQSYVKLERDAKARGFRCRAGALGGSIAKIGILLERFSLLQGTHPRRGVEPPSQGI